jgi:hypothetical protein
LYAVHTSEMSVDNHFTRQYIPEDNSEQEVNYSYQKTKTSGWPILVKLEKVTQIYVKDFNVEL